MEQTSEIWICAFAVFNAVSHEEHHSPSLSEASLPSFRLVSS